MTTTVQDVDLRYPVGKFDFDAPISEDEYPRLIALIAEAPGALRSAVAQGQLELHYQPKVDLATGRICGVEALLRIDDPDDGLIGPQRFIGVLEESRLIDRVGRWVMEEALRAQARDVGRDDEDARADHRAGDEHRRVGEGHRFDESGVGLRRRVGRNGRAAHADAEKASRRRRRLLPQAQLELLLGMGHTPWLEDATTVRQAVRRFIENIATTAPS